MTNEYWPSEPEARLTCSICGGSAAAALAAGTNAALSAAATASLMGGSESTKRPFGNAARDGAGGGRNNVQPGRRQRNMNTTVCKRSGPRGDAAYHSPQKRQRRPASAHRLAERREKMPGSEGHSVAKPPEVGFAVAATAGSKSGTGVV